MAIYRLFKQVVSLYGIGIWGRNLVFAGKRNLHKVLSAIVSSFQWKFVTIINNQKSALWLNAMLL